MSGLLLGAAWVVLLLSYVVLLLYAWRQKPAKSKLHLIIDPFFMLLRQRRVFNGLHPLLHRSQFSLAVLNGGICRREMLIEWTAESVGMAYMAFMVPCTLAMMSGNTTLLVMGLIIAVSIPFLRMKEIHNKVEKRRLLILMELPELLNRLLLLVNAGENVMRALARCVDQQSGTGHPLYVELQAALECMKRGESMSLALEEMGRRCAVPEVKLFATTLLMNARRGGDTFVPALRELTRQMWDRRKAIARTLGEQASSRLAFPLAVIFLLIMVLVGAPTLLMM